MQSSIVQPFSVVEERNHANTMKQLGLVQRKAGATDELVVFMSCDLVSFSILDSPFFKKFVASLNPSYTLPSRRVFAEKLLEEKYLESKINVMHLLKCVPFLTVSLDIWSSCQRSYFGLVAQYLKDCAMQQVVLCCKIIERGASVDEVAQYFEETIQWFGLHSKVTCVVTDNVVCAANRFSLQGFGGENSNNEQMDDNKISASYQEVYAFLSVTTSSSFEYLLRHVIETGFESDTELKTILQKVSKCISYSPSPVLVPYGVEYNISEWDAQLKSIRSYLKLSTETSVEVHSDLTLNAYEKDVLKDMLDIIEPFEEAISFCKQNNALSAGYVVPCIRGLRHYYEKLKSEYNKLLVTSLKSGIETWLQTSEDCDSFKVAAVLDPRFKLNWCHSNEERLAIRSQLLHEASTINSQFIMSIKEENDAPSRKRSKLFSFMDLSPMENQTSSQSMHLDAEVQSYLEQPRIAEDCNLLEFWKSKQQIYPALSKLSEKYLTTPITSASILKAYKMQCTGFNLDRCQLLGTDFEAAMFIRCNKRNY